MQNVEISTKIDQNSYSKYTTARDITNIEK